ncbi:MAG: NAD(P) transhydrogenase subunit alpha [Pseudomonadota bacterium]
MANFDQVKDAANELAEAAKNLADMAGQASEAAAAAAATGAAAAAGSSGIDPFFFQLSIFAMACFVGYYVVWSVTPALHTPLMSVTNAISSVIVVGGIIALGAGAQDGGTVLTRIMGFIAVALASVNIFGGFMVTERMLAMYKKKD